MTSGSWCFGIKFVCSWWLCVVPVRRGNSSLILRRNINLFSVVAKRIMVFNNMI